MNDHDRAAAILRREYGSSRNRVTPNVLDRVLVAPGVAVELSEGPGKLGGPIFGVSVVVENPDGTTQRVGTAPEEPLRSGILPTRGAAERRIEELKVIARRAEN